MKPCNDAVGNIMKLKKEKEREKIRNAPEILCVRACTGYSYPSTSVIIIYLPRYFSAVHSQILK